MNLKPQADKLYSKLTEIDGKFYKKRQIYPYLSKEGKINWFNALTGGTWLKLILVIIAVSILLLAINEYYSNIKLAGACLRALPDNINLKFYLDNPNLINNFTNLIP